MLETRNAISRTEVVGGPLNATLTSLDSHSRALTLKREASRSPFTAAECRRMYPRVHQRTDAFKLYAHSDGFTPKAATSSPLESLPTVVEDRVEEKFNWFKNWWVVQLLDNLETDRPNKIQLLNKDFIVWKGHSGNWIAMDDECPHRLAPLSEGRIEDDGNLLCSYHAWRFNESGKCIKIPHAEDEKAHSVACNSPRSAVQTYPCKIRGPLLWIWPDRSDTAFVESSKKQFPLDDDIADAYERDVDKRLPIPYIRYVPYSYDTLLENVGDPAHVIVSHHGVSPMLNRYNAAPVNMQRTQPVSNKDVVEATAYYNVPIDGESHLELRLPGVLVYRNKRADGKTVRRTYVSATPVCQGKCMLTLVELPQAMISKPPQTNFFMKPFSPFRKHLSHSLFYNRLFSSDAVLLHEQDKKIKEQGTLFSARNKYFVPTNADTIVMAFRKWFETAGQHGAAFGGDEPLGPEAELSKRELLDVYEQHTKHCKVCKQGLSYIKNAILAFKTLSAFSGIVACVLLWKESSVGTLSLLSIAKNVKLVISALISALSLVIANYWEKKFIPLFYFVDHSHADMN